MVVASSQRRRPLARRRGVVVATVAGRIGLAVFVVLSIGGRPAAEVRAERFVEAWARSDYAAIRPDRAAEPGKARPRADFSADYRAAAATGTATAFVPGKVGKLEDGIVSVPM